jgi:hypothetical protein
MHPANTVVLDVEQNPFTRFLEPLAKNGLLTVPPIWKLWSLRKCRLKQATQIRREGETKSPLDALDFDVSKPGGKLNAMHSSA